MPFGASGCETSPAVSEALADDTFQRLLGSLPIVEAVRGTVRVAEIELGEIAVQMLLRAMLVDAPHAPHAPVEDAEIAFDGVGVDEAANVLALL